MIVSFLKTAVLAVVYWKGIANFLSFSKKPQQMGCTSFVGGAIPVSISTEGLCRCTSSKGMTTACTSFDGHSYDLVVSASLENLCKPGTLDSSTLEGFLLFVPFW